MTELPHTLELGTVSSDILPDVRTVFADGYRSSIDPHDPNNGSQEYLKFVLRNGVTLAHDSSSTPRSKRINEVEPLRNPYETAVKIADIVRHGLLSRSDVADWLQMDESGRDLQIFGSVLDVPPDAVQIGITSIWHRDFGDMQDARGVLIYDDLPPEFADGTLVSPPVIAEGLNAKEKVHRAITHSLAIGAATVEEPRKPGTIVGFDKRHGHRARPNKTGRLIKRTVIRVTSFRHKSSALGGL